MKKTAPATLITLSFRGRRRRVLAQRFSLGPRSPVVPWEGGPYLISRPPLAATVNAVEARVQPAIIPTSWKQVLGGAGTSQGELVSPVLGGHPLIHPPETMGSLVLGRGLSIQGLLSFPHGTYQGLKLGGREGARSPSADPPRRPASVDKYLKM